MTLEVFISREARTDIAHAVNGYRDITPALSARFGAELKRVYSDIAEYPQMYPVVYKNFRRALLRRFPYSVFYIVEETSILIVAVVHQARDESIWKGRA